MEKGNMPVESAPPYPGPPMNYAGPPPPQLQPQQGMYPPQAGPYPPQAGPYPPPPVYQGGAAAPYPAAQAVPVSTVTHVMVSPVLGERPGQASCPHCRQNVITRIQYTAGLMTWLICGAMAMFGFFLCCCIPFCIDACQDVEHHCPNCNNIVYIYKRI